MNTLSGEQPPLIKALMDPERYDHSIENLQLVETHISWVVLTGSYVYKIKKPVDFGFLDFSTLEKRRFYCYEELRLNRRLAPAIYLEVIAVTGSAEHPQWGGEGEPIEYAVKMAQFPQEAQLDRILKRGDLRADQIDAIARLAAEFHKQIEVAGADTDYGDPEHVWAPVDENMVQIQERISEPTYLESLALLRLWSKQVFDETQPLFELRKANGFIRECHGDMHLRNIAWVNNAPLIFDCIEFNPNLRWIDVMSEVAFLVMDLQDRKRPLLAQRFLNTYLECSGDYAGLRVLRYYLVYRALVRAKVDAIRLTQPGIRKQEFKDDTQEFCRYLELAQQYSRTTTPQLLITRGMSASGKTTITQPLLERLGAIRIRSDVERKRLAGISAQESGKAAIGKGLYSKGSSEKTYAHLLKLAREVLIAGYTVIIDAACLKYEQRECFRKLAEEMDVVFHILEFNASANSLRSRIVARKHDASDADIAVLEHQLARWQPVYEQEQPYVIEVDTETSIDIAALVIKIAPTTG